uniref:G-protein coupled receptors family 1 profile domain-containing protein n=1 Tax=Periophthalmus magnuspinnatus TaxID=409849 RepID=A0A3B3ZQD8_9GOBI
MSDDDIDSSFRSSIPPALDLIVAVVYTVFGVCSLMGNSTLLYVSYKKKHQLKPAEFFIINLAISDLGLTLSLYPMAITSSFYHRWLYGRTVCSIYAFCGMLFGLCSLTTLTLLSTVCFVKVCYPLYGNRFKALHGRLLIGFAWLYALVFAGSPLAHWGEYGPEPYGTACCIDWRLSNLRPGPRSYTVALFLLCYILPCAVILASYSCILITVQASRKTMEQHASRQTHMSSIQAIIVKLSVAVCIGFLTAWSPYAVVSMWAAFGRVDAIPPLAFALPAMFAKSSTIYNPVIYLLLRPNFRKVMRRDLRTLYRACLKGCPCLQPETAARLPTIHRQSPSPDPNAPPAVDIKDNSSKRCSDAFECFRHYPQTCSAVNSVGKAEGKDVAPPTPQNIKEKGQRSRKCPLVSICTKRTPEIDNLHIDLEVVPGQAKVAWP